MGRCSPVESEVASNYRSSVIASVPGMMLDVRVLCDVVEEEREG